MGELFRDERMVDSMGERIREEGGDKRRVEMRGGCTAYTVYSTYRTQYGQWWRGEGSLEGRLHNIDLWFGCGRMVGGQERR